MIDGHSRTDASENVAIGACQVPLFLVSTQLLALAGTQTHRRRWGAAGEPPSPVLQHRGTAGAHEVDGLIELVHVAFGHRILAVDVPLLALALVAVAVPLRTSTATDCNIASKIV